MVVSNLEQFKINFPQILHFTCTLTTSIDHNHYLNHETLSPSPRKPCNRRLNQRPKASIIGPTASNSSLQKVIPHTPKPFDPRMRLLGDEYVKSEFRAHRNVENPMHIVRPCPRHWCNSFLSISLGYGPLLTAVSTDWILDRVADVCAED